MKLTPVEERILRMYLEEMKNHKEVLKMKDFIQHGTTSTYDHVLEVARLAFLLSRRLPWSFHEKSIVKGAMLHDFYLYDWHVRDPKRKRFHGLHHHKTAHKNAMKYFRLTPLEEDIILKHMWPLTIRFPKYRESYLVSIADKIVSMKDTLGIARRKEGP